MLRKAVNINLGSPFMKIMKHLTPQHTRSHKTILKPFAKFLVLGSGLMLAGCMSKDWSRQFNDWLVPPQKHAISDEEGQRKLIHLRLAQRKFYANRILAAWKYAGLGSYKAQLISEMTVHGTVSPRPGEYDTTVITCLGIYARSLDSISAREASEQLISIKSICRDSSISMRMGAEALRGALDNPALGWGMKWRIARSLRKEDLPLLEIAEMPPCCTDPRQAGQTRLDSLAMRMLVER
jgi:hypothetical protein